MCKDVFANFERGGGEDQVVDVAVDEVCHHGRLVCRLVRGQEGELGERGEGDGWGADVEAVIIAGMMGIGGGVSSSLCRRPFLPGYPRLAFRLPRSLVGVFLDDLAACRPTGHPPSALATPREHRPTRPDGRHGHHRVLFFSPPPSSFAAPAERLRSLHARLLARPPTRASRVR